MNWNRGVGTTFNVVAGTASILGASVFIFNKRRNVDRWLSDRWDSIYPTSVVLALLLIVVALIIALVRTKGSQASGDGMGSADTDPNLLAADRALFASFSTFLPSTNRSLEFVHNHSFDIPYSDDDRHDLEKYAHEWNTADRQFHDATVEASRQKFFAAVRTFLNHLNQHAFVVERGLYRIYPNHDLDWENEDNRFAIEAVRKADELGIEVWETHQDLVATARRELRV